MGRRSGRGMLEPPTCGGARPVARPRGFSVRSLRNTVVEDERGRSLFPMGLHLCRFTRTQCGGAFAFFSGVTAKQMPEKATTVICVPKRAEQSGRNFEIDHDVRLRVSRAPKRVLHFFHVLLFFTVSGIRPRGRSPQCFHLEIVAASRTK